MRDEVNRVAHKQEGTSDKVYMACLRWDVSKKEWLVLGKWGRRGKKMSSQVKWNGSDRATAERVRDQLFRDKVSEGYEDVDSAGYSGPLSRRDPVVTENLEEDDRKPAAREPKEKPVERRVANPETMAAVCADRIGLEDRFDEGIEYVFENHRDGTMVWVYDKLGRKAEYFADRFRFVEAS